MLDAQPTASQPVQQPWDTAEQQAFRAEITAAWAGRPAAAGPADANGADALLTTTGQLGVVTAASGFAAQTADFGGAQAPGFAAPASGFGAQAPGLVAPGPGLAAPEAALLVPAPAAAPDPFLPEAGLTATPIGHPLPEPGLRARESGILTPDGGIGGLTVTNGYPAPEPVLAAAPSGYPMPDFGLPATDPGFRTPGADAFTAGVGHPASGPVVAAPPLGYATPEAPPTAPEYGFAAETGVTVPAWDVVTVGSGYPAAVGLAAPAAPVPAAVPSPAAPADATSHTTGTAYLGKADKALAFARAQVGRPCVWGATGPESYDCSSLTQAAWRAAGVTLPRSAIDQAKAFTRISLADLRPGDLVFFFDDLSHTGLCTGDGMMIHAPGPGASIREEAILPFGEGALRGAVRPA
ncbi:C40 family peptidase [Streptomyces sp. NPDC000658]|uniref:C40 family peptidase n=1 Tax=Streptomyces sp. NPDC000658 TaxID=3154266 RepID=UPI00332C7F83